MRWLLAALILTSAAACSLRSYPPACLSRGWDVPPESLQRKVTDIARERAAFIRSLELRSLPAAARQDVERQFSEQFDELERAKSAGAEVWAFRYDKCRDCGWYREGYVAVRDCAIVCEVETRDMM
jgi:hypothetical protein